MNISPEEYGALKRRLAFTHDQMAALFAVTSRQSKTWAKSGIPDSATARYAALVLAHIDGLDTNRAISRAIAAARKAAGG